MLCLKDIPTTSKRSLVALRVCLLPRSVVLGWHPTPMARLWWQPLSCERSFVDFVFWLRLDSALYIFQVIWVICNTFFASSTVAMDDWRRCAEMPASTRHLNALISFISYPVLVVLVVWDSEFWKDNKVMQKKQVKNEKIEKMVVEDKPHHSEWRNLAFGIGTSVWGDGLLEREGGCWCRFRHHTDVPWCSSLSWLRSGQDSRIKKSCYVAVVSSIRFSTECSPFRLLKGVPQVRDPCPNRARHYVLERPRPLTTVIRVVQNNALTCRWPLKLKNRWSLECSCYIWNIKVRLKASLSIITLEVKMVENVVSYILTRREFFNMWPQQAVWSAWRSFARLACQRAWWNVLRRQDMSSMLSKFYHFFRNPQKWQGFARSKSECHDDGWSLQENVWTSYWHYIISTTLLSCVWSAQQRSICWLPLRPTPQMRPSRPSVSRSVSCPLNEPWREILPIWIGWEFCIRHVPRPWKSNSTVQPGRRRHVQEASGRWRTRLAGKEKFYQFKQAIPQKPQEVSRILRCRDWIHERSTRLCSARSAFLHLEFGEGSDDSPHKTLQSRSSFALLLGQVLGIAAFASAKFFNLAFLIMIAIALRISTLQLSTDQFWSFNLSALQVVVGILKGLGKISVARRENSCWVQYGRGFFWRNCRNCRCWCCRKRGPASCRVPAVGSRCKVHGLCSGHHHWNQGTPLKILPISSFIHELILFFSLIQIY